MSLGQNICRLRTERDMSQGGLAEALGVSRQSISKWETDTSVPELDKLLKLSQLFGVTLDELVKGEAAETPPEAENTPREKSSPEPEVQYVYVHPKRSRQKTAGTILLCTAFLVAFLLAMLGGILEGLILASPFLACGLVCLFCRKNAGLWCGWILFLFADLYLTYGTSVSRDLIWYTFSFTPEQNYSRLIWAWIHVLFMLSLIVITVLRGRRCPIDLKAQRRSTLITAGILIAALILRQVLALTLPWDFMVTTDSLGNRIFNSWFRYFDLAFEWLKIGLATALLTLIVRCIPWKTKSNT